MAASPRRPGSIATGSAALPLDDEGKSQADALADRFAAKGGVDLVVSSDLPRALDTAKVIAAKSRAKLVATPLLHPWRIGPMEGKPEDEVRPKLIKLAKETPGKSIDGMSAVSTEPGESFDAARGRIVPVIQLVADLHKLYPKLKIAIVTHSKVIDMAKATSAGTTDVDKMFKNKTEVGDVYGGDGQKIDMASDDPIEPGIHLVRHGHTAWDQDKETNA